MLLLACLVVLHVTAAAASSAAVGGGGGGGAEMLFSDLRLGSSFALRNSMDLDFFKDDLEDPSLLPLRRPR